MDLPIPWNDSLVDLFLLVLLQRWDHAVLCMPCVLILHNTPLSLFQDLQNNRWNVRLLPEILDRCKQRLEVEAYSTGKWQPSKSLPVNAQIAARYFQVVMLDFAMLLMWISRRHKERLIDLETPGTALDCLVGRLLRKVSVFIQHRKSNELGQNTAYLSIENRIFSL